MNRQASADVSEAAATRQAALSALLDAIEADPHAYDFFAVLRRVESLFPESPPWGRAARPSQEGLRLSQDADLDFAPAALSRLDRSAPVAPRLGVRFFGLFGSQGPMPLHITEYARERQRLHGDPTMARFFDIFHHRLLTLFYRAWAQAQPTTHLDRVEHDRFSAWLGSSIGFGGAGSTPSAIPASAELFQAGLLASRSRHPEGLRKLLTRFFDVPVQIVEHVAQWLVLDRADRTRLGHARNRREGVRAERARLGETANSGTKVHDRQFRFRIVLGPLTLAQYRAFLPDGTGWPLLCDWVARYAGIDLRWDLELVLKGSDVPAPRLGRHVRLGLTTWIGNDEAAGAAPRDRADLHLHPTHQRVPH